jgi:hypothetical protein
VKLTWKNLILFLVVAFVLILFWNDPTSFGTAVGDFFRSVGSWLGDLFNKFADFVSNLTKK